MSYGALIQRPLGRPVLVGAAADEVDLEAAVVVQEHVGAVAVDRAVGEQHTDGESGLHVFRQVHEFLVRIPIRVHGDGCVRHIGVAVTVFVHVAHKRQVPSVMRGEGCLEFLHLSEGFVADAEALGNLVGCGGLGVRVLAEHVQIHVDDGLFICHDEFLSCDMFA